MLDTVNEKRFASMPTCEIVPILADEGTYIASESTFYRILREEKMQNHRGRSQEPGKHGKPTSYVATAPNQVWTWDITYLIMECLHSGHAIRIHSDPLFLRTMIHIDG